MARLTLTELGCSFWPFSCTNAKRMHLFKADTLYTLSCWNRWDLEWLLSTCCCLFYYSLMFPLNWGTNAFTSRWKSFSFKKNAGFTLKQILAASSMFSQASMIQNVYRRFNIEGQIYWDEPMLCGEQSLSPLTCSLIYCVCALIDFFFPSLWDTKMKELQSLSSMTTQPTHPSSFKIPFYLPLWPGMDSGGWHDVLAFLPSTPIGAIFQAAWLWYYGYYMSFSFFSLVPSLWFHLKVHCHGQSEVIEFHLPSLVFSYTSLHRTAGETPTDPLPELWGHEVQSREILRNDNKLSNADYMLRTQIMYTLHFSSVIWRLISRQRGRHALK